MQGKRGFRRLRTAGSFSAWKRNQKTPGVCSEEHRSGAPSRCTPGPPLRGTLSCSVVHHFRRTKSEWVSKSPPGHWALGLQKFPLLRFHNRAWGCRTNVPGGDTTVGATLAAAPYRYHSSGNGRQHGGAPTAMTAPERWFGKLRRSSRTAPETNFVHSGPQWGRTEPHPSTPDFARRNGIAHPKGITLVNGVRGKANMDTKCPS